MSGLEATHAQVRDCAGHMMWGTITDHVEYVECSCGWRWETVFDDYCALTDIELHGRHVRYVIAYPETEDRFPGMMVIHDGDELDLARADLHWLLAQPDLPDEFRRAAAVHLEH